MCSSDLFNSSLISPSFTPSILKRGETVCHSYVKNGQIKFFADSTHDLTGQTVDLPVIELESGLKIRWDDGN